MSMNLHIYSVMEVTTPNNKKKTIKEYFSCYQISSRISYQIRDSENPIETYKKYLLDNFPPEKVARYAEDDILCQGEIIGYEMDDYAAKHINQLNEFINNAKEYGADIEMIVM